MRNVVIKTGWMLILTLLLLLPSGFAQEDMEYIDHTVFEKPARPPSVFPHDRHNEKAEIEDCAVCHHVYEDGVLLEDESSEDQRCSECHTTEAQGGAPHLMRAFHKNCKECHLARKAGPILCGECHKRADR